jgi:hypothetical protein
VIFPYFQHEQKFLLLPTKVYWKFEIVLRRGHKKERHRVFDGWPAEAPFLEQRYPLLSKYLEANERKLRRRKQGRFMKGKHEEWCWYDLARPQNLAAAHRPKIVAQLLARSAQFAFDPHGKFLFQAGGKGGGVYGIMLNDNVEPAAILALLNSKTVDFYLRHITQFYNPASSCSYADVFLKHLPIAGLSPSDRKSLKKSSTKLSESASLHERLTHQIGSFPQSVTDYLMSIGSAVATEQVSNLAEVSNLPTIIRSDIMTVQDLLDGRVCLTFGRGTIWADKELGRLIERAISGRQQIDRAEFLNLAYPERPKDRSRYLEIVEGWERELHKTKTEIVRLEDEGNLRVLDAYGLSDSDMSIIEKFLQRF